MRHPLWWIARQVAAQNSQVGCSTSPQANRRANVEDGGQPSPVRGDIFVATGANNYLAPSGAASSRRIIRRALFSTFPPHINRRCRPEWGSKNIACGSYKDAAPTALPDRGRRKNRDGGAGHLVGCIRLWGEWAAGCRPKQLGWLFHQSPRKPKGECRGRRITKPRQGRHLCSHRR